MGTHASELPTSVVMDLCSSLIGEEIGWGMSRRTFVWPPNENLVLKLETGKHYQNAYEYETWRQLEHTEHSKWLAPVVWISSCTTALLMHRTEPLRKGEEPKALPEWLGDLKRSNYGKLLGKVVCHDYGTNMLLNHGACGAKMRKIKASDWSEK